MEHTMIDPATARVVDGVRAAIGNAIFHTTGRRLREVPFTRDELL